MNRIAIRREEYSKWQRCTPLVPDDVIDLVVEDIPIRVQRSEIRAFVDAAYETAGAAVIDDISDADLVMGIKEIAPEAIDDSRAWMFFSHTIKGQPHNMAMLKKIIATEGTLLDYELIVDDDGQRLVYFGDHAGYAGAIETLVALARRWNLRGYRTPLDELRQPYQYTHPREAIDHLREIAAAIETDGLPHLLAPLRIAVMGDGNTSRGVQRVLDALPVRWYEPDEYLKLDDDADRDVIHATILRERHMVAPRDDRSFDVDDYYDHPDAYRPVVRRFLASSEVVVVAYYWDDRYPRFVTNDDLCSLGQSDRLPLEVIGDITCDIDGSVEPTIRHTDPENPVYTFVPETGESFEELRDEGVSVMAVNTLPGEFSIDASRHFSEALKPFVPSLARAHFEAPTLEDSNLPPMLRRACIVWRGELTRPFRRLQSCIEQYG